MIFFREKALEYDVWIFSVILFRSQCVDKISIYQVLTICYNKPLEDFYIQHYILLIIVMNTMGRPYLAIIFLNILTKGAP